MNRSPRRPAPVSLFFRLVIGAAALFIVTVLAIVAAVFSDPSAPAVQFLDQHGGTILEIEVIATLLIGFLALAIDRWQTLRTMRAQQTLDPSPADSSDPLPVEGLE